MSRKKAATLEEKRRFPNKRLLLLSIILVSIIILAFMLSFMLLQTPNKFSLKAAIIDQLGEDCSNPDFVANVTNILNATGFTVTYHESKSVNVTFFKELAKYNYGIIILRVHTALRADNSTVDLFTSEEYAEDKYVAEQENVLLTQGSYLGRPEKFFAVTPGFIENLEGRFPRSVVIAMGCWSLKQGCEEMAEAFIKKGAEVYIGWTDTVGSSHTDNETIKLLRMLLEKNETIEDAVYRITPDWNFAPGSKMKYYPRTDAVGNLKISDLIAEAKTFSSHQGAITFLNQRLLFAPQASF